ncbi:hypothetical protein MPER_11386 [Moniliophthora perniciosa FA553]|nr:hypothetical protein MPER_11386 [Moniliophthora perniciosa FA553]
MVACKVLAEMGIKTLATCLFSVPQAVAASQASCVYVAPYFNELRVHFEPSLWREYTNPAEDHPMSQTIISIKQSLQAIGSKTQVYACEVVSLVSLKPDHITISGGLLDKLSQEKPVPGESFVTSLQPKIDETQLSTDYLVQSGEALRQAIQNDEEVARKVADALSLFDDFEKKTRELVKALL